MSDDLKKLIEAVEASSISYSNLDPFVAALGMNTQANDAHMAYRGSLDAAKALHEALLPGWIFDLTNGSCFVCPGLDDDDATTSGQYAGESDVWSRAWLLAILRALVGQAEGGKG